MPPPEAERPPSADTAAVLTWAKTGLAVAAKVRRAEGGRVAIRRLNRLEYENTLHDLLGLPLPLRDLLPEDGTSDGFDTASAALAISPVHMQRFMDAARTALEAVAVRGPRPGPGETDLRGMTRECVDAILAGRRRRAAAPPHGIQSPHQSLHRKSVA